MKTTKHKTDEGLNLLNTFAFQPKIPAIHGYSILLSDLYHASGEDSESDLSDWGEAKFEELDIDRGEYLHYFDVLCQEEEFHLKFATGLKIACTFENDHGAAARRYRDNIDDGNSENESGDEAPTQTMLAKLQRHECKFHKLLSDSSMWYRIGQMHKHYSSEPNDPKSGDEVIEAAYSKDASDLANEKMMYFGARKFSKVLKVIAKMEAIYASPLYTEAVAQGLAPSVTGDGNSTPNHNQ